MAVANEWDTVIALGLNGGVIEGRTRSPFALSTIGKIPLSVLRQWLDRGSDEERHRVTPAAHG